MVAPKSFSIRMYNVGFGDCFLLTFDYGPDGKRHILFDHGSTSRARTRLSLASIAAQVAKDTDGKLDALVVTHRHRDHLSGLGTKAGKAIRDLNPTLVIRSWTEDPDLKSDTGKPAPLAGTGATISAAPTVKLTNDRYLAAINEGQRIAGDILRKAELAGRTETNLATAAEEAVTNPEALDALEKLSKNGAGEYLYAGKTAKGYRTTRLAKLLPGVKVHVLGPPRPSDWPDVATQADESEEFWIGAPKQVRRAFAPSRSPRGLPAPGTARWIVDQLRGDEDRQLAGLVRWLDDVLNNTSVILLFEVGKHGLLFGGDAQIENWTWALHQAANDPALKKALSEVTVYKVGHHGSRNATPISLYKLWKAQDPVRFPFVAMMSTKRGLHGEGAHAVPRATLKTALAERGELLSTDDGNVDWIQVSADVSSREFVVTTGLIDD
jgi:hypothetical protein